MSTLYNVSIIFVPRNIVGEFKQQDYLIWNSYFNWLQHYLTTGFVVILEWQHSHPMNFYKSHIANPKIYLDQIGIEASNYFLLKGFENKMYSPIRIFCVTDHNHRRGWTINCKCLIYWSSFYYLQSMTKFVNDLCIMLTSIQNLIYFQFPI